MSGVVGHKGSKSALVGDGGRVRVDALDVSRTQSESTGTVSYSLDFQPKAGVNMGCNGTSTIYGVGWGIFSSTPVASGSNNSIGNSTSGVRDATGDWGRWEGPWISHNDSSPSNEGQMYRQTAGSNYMWQYKITALNTSGVDIYWHRPVATSSTGFCRTLMLR